MGELTDRTSINNDYGKAFQVTVFCVGDTKDNTYMLRVISFMLQS